MSCVLCTVLKKNSVIFGPSYDVGIEYIVVGKNAYLGIFLRNPNEVTRDFTKIYAHF